MITKDKVFFFELHDNKFPLESITETLKNKCLNAVVLQKPDTEFINITQIPMMQPGSTGTLIIVVSYNKYFIHIPKTGGKYFFRNYHIYRQQQVGDHVTFKSVSKSVDIGSIKKNKPNRIDCVTIVRNPYDWLVSMFFHYTEMIDKILKINEKDDILKFRKFVHDLCSQESNKYDIIFPFNEGMTSQLFDDNNNLIVKDIIYYEKIAKEKKYTNIENRVFCPKTKQLKNVYDFTLFSEKNKWDAYENFKYHSVDSKRYYKNFYTQNEIDLVANKFKFDLSFLDYDYDGVKSDKSELIFHKEYKRGSE